jgi:hypothetical protein
MGLVQHGFELTPEVRELSFRDGIDIHQQSLYLFLAGYASYYRRHDLNNVQESALDDLGAEMHWQLPDIVIGKADIELDWLNGRLLLEWDDIRIF